MLLNKKKCSVRVYVLEGQFPSSSPFTHQWISKHDLVLQSAMGI